MDDSVLWVVAIGTGALGVLLLTVAGAVAVYWNTVARRPKRATSVEKSQSRAEDTAAAKKKRPPARPTEAQPAAAGSPWLWVKAWLFAFFHASVVSLVLGAITFFEDLAKASEEIQAAGTVTFPKQLLPGSLSGSASRKRLLQSSGDSAKVKGDAEAGKLDQPDAASSSEVGWEVVDLVNEVSADGS